ncbi:uncharacterized protein LOC135394956 [Ornithodoros turicata]|uniref:uncharacterized protein LOC135394956 n=1 Tax=Ornithodoros turicata TaxID=34597 RepID=UPI0031388950
MAQEVQPAPGQQNSGTIQVEEANSAKETATLNEKQGATCDAQHPEVRARPVEQGGERPPEEVASEDLFTKQSESLCTCYEQRALALERAANATRQAEGLRVQLAQSQAHAKQIGDAWERRLKEVEMEYSERVTKLSAEVDGLRAQLADAELQLSASKHHCEEVGRKNQVLEQKLSSVDSSSNEDLQKELERVTERSNHLSKALAEERHRNRQLTADAGLHQQQIAILEAQLEERLLELKHKDEVLELFGTKALEHVARSVGPSGRTDLLRLVAVLTGSSWLGEEIGRSASNGESGKCDSGYQGSIAGAVPKASAGTKPVEEKAAESEDPVEVKKEIRRCNEKLKKLLWRRRSQVHALENSLDADSKPRLSSTGFEPGCDACLLPGAVRKVGARKERQLSSTPRVALETLSDVSSISQDVADDAAGFNGPSSEMKDTSGSVFLWDCNEKRNRRSSRRREVSDESPRFKAPSSETKDTPGSRKGTDYFESRVLGSSSGRSDFKAKDSAVRSNGTSQYVQKDHVSASGMKGAATTAAVTDRYKSKARRSLNFAQHDTAERTMPFSFSSNSSAHSSNVAQVSLTFATPMVINISSIPQPRTGDVAT